MPTARKRKKRRRHTVSGTAATPASLAAPLPKKTQARLVAPRCLLLRLAGATGARTAMVSGITHYMPTARKRKKRRRHTVSGTAATPASLAAPLPKKTQARLVAPRCFVLRLLLLQISAVG